MGNEQNLCYRCRFFDRYYTKGIREFEKTKLGWCCEKMQTVVSQGGCGEYELRKRRKDYGLIAYHLSDLLAQVSSLRQIIEEKYDVTNEPEDV